MKKIVLFISALFISCQIQAQSEPIPAGVKEAFLEKNGKTWIIKRVPKKDITFANGMTLIKGEKVKMPNGKRYNLYRGDVIDFDGCFVRLNQEFDSAIVKYYGTWVWTLISQPVTFNNGIYATPRGVIEVKNGIYKKLKEGQVLSIDKNISEKETEFVQGTW